MLLHKSKPTFAAGFEKKARSHKIILDPFGPGLVGKSHALQANGISTHAGFPIDSKLIGDEHGERAKLFLRKFFQAVGASAAAFTFDLGGESLKKLFHLDAWIITHFCL